MKLTRFLLIISLIICCLLAVCSCAEKLPAVNKPTGLEVEQATLLLTWNEVKDARLYAISIHKAGQEEPKEFIASKPNYSLASLEEGEYTVKVMARGKDGVSRDSEWSKEITFVREHEPGMVFTLNSDKTGYIISAKGSATGNVIIPDTYRGLPVVAIGDRAFFNKSDVTSVTFGEDSNVKSIGTLAFANCSYLASMNLPDRLETIGNNAFASCRMLAVDMVIPEGVKTISQNAFAYCAVTSIVLPESLTTIEKYAFTDCKGLTEIIIPNNVKTVGEYAFAACENVSSIVLGSKLEEIGIYAFSRCNKTVSLEIPDNVRSLGEGAFYQCEALVTVDLGEGITAIGAGAFNSTKLWEDTTANEVYVGNWLLGLKDATATKVDILPTTIGIASFAFVNNRSLVDVVIPNSVKIIGEGAFAGSNIVSFLLGSGVEVLGEQAFISCKKLSTVILGTYDSVLRRIEFSSLKEIGNYAFQECEALLEIEIPESVKTVGSYVFKDSGLGQSADNGIIYAGVKNHGSRWVVGYLEDILGEIKIADGTYGIANYAFYNCGTITSVKIPSSVKTIGRAAFYDCSAIKSVELPSTLEVIEEFTFYRCRNLRLFALPETLKYIGRSAFYKCASSNYAMDIDEASKTLRIPSSVEYIGDYAFYGCVYEVASGGNTDRYGIENLIIGSGVQSIGANAFYGVSSLKKVEMVNVKTIGEKAFYKCVLLETVDFGASLESVDDKAFHSCESLTAVNLPDSVETIGDYAFYKCWSLATLHLGESVTSIGDYAFYGNLALKELKLPVSLSAIGKQAFRNCDQLTAIIIPDSVTDIDKHAFYGCDNLTIYTELSAAPEGWIKYWNSSYRPIMWNCTLSAEKDYVVSFEKEFGGITNKNDSNTLSAPLRSGYSFGGWCKDSSLATVDYTMETLTDAETGSILFAKWEELPVEP